MAITRLELQTDIYEILSKEPTSFGLLTPAKVNKMIQDSLVLISYLTKGPSSGTLW